ncbi:MAG: glycosyltransferase [Nitrospinota bacterium]
MKILFSGYHNPDFITITEYIEFAIKGSGHEPLIFDNRRFVIPGRIRDRVQLLHKIDIKRINKDLLSRVRRFKPDIFLETGGNRILPETVDSINREGVKTILWTTDVPIGFVPILEAAPHYNYVFTCGTEAYDILKGVGVKQLHWLPFACDPQFHRPVSLSSEETERYGADICFIGSYYPNRERILEEIVDFNPGIWGPGWERLPDRSPLRRNIKGSKTGPDEWIKIYSASGIALAIHYKDPENKVPCHQASPRVYEVLACGSLLIVDSQKDVLSIFVPGEDLVVFKDTNDLKRLLPYYLEHKDEARRIAKRGREKVINQHTYKHRVEEMLRIVRG